MLAAQRYRSNFRANYLRAAIAMRLHRVIVALLLQALLCLPVAAQVTFDANSTAPTATAAAASPVNHTGLTSGSGSNRCMVAMLEIRNGPPPSLAATWNAVSMTLIASTNAQAQYTAIFGLANQASGNQTLAITWTGGGTFDVYLNAVSFTGCNQTGGTTTFPNGTTNNAATGTTTTISVTSAANHMVAASHGQSGAPWNTNPACNNTEAYQSGALNDNGAGNYASGAATVTMTCSWSTNAASKSWSVSATDIAPVAAAAATPQRMLMGVGQ